MRYLTVVFLAFLGLPALAAPKSQSNDPSAPRAALLMYDKLVGPNQSEKALPLYHATTTRERALAAVLANIDGALANLHQKAKDKFGQQVADELLRSVDATTTQDINDAKIEVFGDTATVLFPGASHPSTMIRVNGEWKISVKAMAQKLQGDLRHFRTGLTRLATAANQIADKIAQGQYSSAEEASQKLKEAYRSAFGA